MQEIRKKKADTAKQEVGCRTTYRPADQQKYLKESDSLIALRVTPEEATLAEGYLTVMDTSVADMTLRGVLQQYIIGKDAAHAGKIRESVEQEVLGAYNAVVKLLGEKETLVHINNGPMKVNLDDKVADHLSLREEVVEGHVKENSGFLLLDIILEKDNTGGYSARLGRYN